MISFIDFTLLRDLSRVLFNLHGANSSILVWVDMVVQASEAHGKFFFHVGGVLRTFRDCVCVCVSVGGGEVYVYVCDLYITPSGTITLYCFFSD